MQAEGGDGAVRIDDVKSMAAWLVLAARSSRAASSMGMRQECRQVHGALGFSGSGGHSSKKLEAVALVGGGVFGG